MNIKPFTIESAPGALADLKTRLKLTRWNDTVADGWSYGTDRAFLRSLWDHWSNAYDWRKREALLNELPHFRADIDGFRVHFLHYRSPRPQTVPLLLMNGWPSSFIEYQRLAPLLANPASDGSEPVRAFDVVIPAIPGFGFSDRPVRPHQVDAADLFFRLMTEALGHSRFAVAGTDIGAGLAIELAQKYPDKIIGIHVTTVADPPLDNHSPPLTPAETEYRLERTRWSTEEGAYSALQRTRPQTLAFGLADSPIGLASWIIEKFYSWSDCEGDVLSAFPMDFLIDNVMIYWLTETIGSSVRYYYEKQQRGLVFRSDRRITPPAAVMTLPCELARPPREWAERLLNVHRYTTGSSGGHFPGWEIPESYAADIRAFFTPLID